MKKLIIKIGNETHELPYNGEVFSFEVEERYGPKDGDKCWVLGSFLQPRFFIYNSSSWFFKPLEKGLLFQTEAECQKFADHCMSYINNKKE